MASVWDISLRACVCKCRIERIHTCVGLLPSRRIRGRERERCLRVAHRRCDGASPATRFWKISLREREEGRERVCEGMHRVDILG